MYIQIPVTYPITAPEIALPELDGKTAKMYRGGKICLTDHFKPLWARNVPKFGIAHAMALGVSFCSFICKPVFIFINKFLSQILLQHIFRKFIIFSAWTLVSS